MTTTRTRHLVHLACGPAPWIALTTLAVGAVVEIGLRFWTVERLARRLGAPLALAAPGPDPVVEGPVLTGRDAQRYRVVRRVMRHWPGGAEGACLRLALTAGFLLRHREPTVRLGVARVRGQVIAHAWLVIDGRALDPSAPCYVGFTGLAR